jgi:hypothetical protein
MSGMEWEDPDDGQIYHIAYMVPQGDTDEREHMVWRKLGSTEWHVLPPFAEPIKEVAEHFFGPLISITKPETREGIIVSMSESDVLIADYDGHLHVADLAEFEFIDGENHGDEVKPGDVIRVRFAEFIEGPKQLREWLKG